MAADDYGSPLYQRYPHDVADAVRIAAEDAGRSISGEIVHRVRRTLEADGYLEAREPRAARGRG